jgi:DNA-binding response OmpR family regulator
MSLQGKSVLIIDDSDEVRFVERKIFENLGLTVLEAGSVDAALNIIDNKLPHLIILDLEMPGKSGFDFLSIRGLTPELKSVPVIVASAHSDRESVHRALSLGASNYVLKPINAAILGQRVRKHARSIDYMQVSFSDVFMPDVTLRTKAQIVSTAEASFMLGSPVRIAKSTQIQLSPPQLDRINLMDYVLMASPESRGKSLSGRYLTKINIMGLKETLSKQFKRMRSI